MGEPAGAPSSPLKKKRQEKRGKKHCLVYTPILKTPICPELTLASILTTLTPCNSCALHSFRRSPEKCQKLFILSWFKEPQSWFSLKAITKRTGMEQTERESGRVREADRLRLQFFHLHDLDWLTQHQAGCWHRARLAKIRPESHFCVFVGWHWLKEMAQDTVFGKDKWSGNTDKNFEQHGFQDFFQ